MPDYAHSCGQRRLLVPELRSIAIACLAPDYGQRKDMSASQIAVRAPIVCFEGTR